MNEFLGIAALWSCHLILLQYSVVHSLDFIIADSNHNDVQIVLRSIEIN